MKFLSTTLLFLLVTTCFFYAMDKQAKLDSNFVQLPEILQIFVKNFATWPATEKDKITIAIRNINPNEAYRGLLFNGSLFDADYMYEGGVCYFLFNSLPHQSEKQQIAFLGLIDYLKQKY